jgi:hypothetical protein
MSATDFVTVTSGTSHPSRVDRVPASILTVVENNRDRASHPDRDDYVR